MKTNSPSLIFNRQFEKSYRNPMGKIYETMLCRWESSNDKGTVDVVLFTAVSLKPLSKGKVKKM